ncbi:response regulator transcription factor [Tardiphaga sp. 538_B7_N1_4]|jgi:FixJ family two-component response regulator|uniref:response regulator transcription factor n=1 Tax=unclassified Tardiphaga TaxID=2631404 RepID=UPI0020122044|nr:response regulator [Bradyrhizobium diazoefficiens]
MEGGVVLVIDDDNEMRAALASLFRSVGLPVVLFGSAAEFLQSEHVHAPGCLVLDIRLPGVNGLDFQNQLAKMSVALPIIFMTGHGDVPMTVRAMKAGAVDFLTKPFRDQDMLDAVYAAIEAGRQRWASEQSAADLVAAYETLTPREKDVMPFVVKGLLNKQIADEMGLSEITVKIHRSNLMRKLGTKSVADLVRASIELGSVNQLR